MTGLTKVWVGINDTPMEIHSTIPGELSFDPSIINVGESVSDFGEHEWIAVHKSEDKLYLTTTTILSKSIVNNTNTLDYTVTQLRQNTTSYLSLFTEYEKYRLVADPTSGDYIAPMTQQQVDGGFSYFSDDTKRICQSERYWTQSLNVNYEGKYFAWVVYENGFVGIDLFGQSYGIRPYVTVWY